MASPRKPDNITPEQYLEIERTSEFRSEYIAGEVVAMPVPSKAHGQILTNISAELWTVLRGKPCEVNVGSSVAAPASYLIPDLVVYCDGGKFSGENEILLDPVIIVEILSKSTGNYDRGEKWIRYQQIESLMHYVLISQDEPRVDVFTREPNGDWHYHSVQSLNGQVALSFIQCQIPLAEIYDRVVFAA